MLLKLLLVGLLVFLAIGGGRRLFGLAKGVRSLPQSFRDGKGRAEDPAAYAKEVRGRARSVDDKR